MKRMDTDKAGVSVMRDGGRYAFAMEGDENGDEKRGILVSPTSKFGFGLVH